MALPVMIAGMVMLTSCGSSAGEPVSDAGETAASEVLESLDEKKEETAATESTGGEDSGNTRLANPWKDNVSADDVYDLVNAYFIVPLGATNEVYRIMESDKLAEMDFERDGLKFTARMKPASAFEDISGMNYEWTADEPDDNIGDESRARRFISDEETVDSLLWYDKTSGMMFSLSTSDKDLDGFDITAIASEMYQPETEEFMPGSFVEEAAGKNNFTSYDEVLSYLKTGTGYAYFELEGYDGKLLAVAEKIYDDKEGHKVASEATFYGDFNGTVKFVGNAFSGGEAYPLKCDKTAVYDARDNAYESEFMGPQGDALIVKDYIIEDTDEQGNVTYSGFRRAENTSEGDDLPKDPAEAGKVFSSLMEEYGKKPVMEFTAK